MQINANQAFVFSSLIAIESLTFLHHTINRVGRYGVPFVSFVGIEEIRR